MSMMGGGGTVVKTMGDLVALATVLADPKKLAALRDEFAGDLDALKKQTDVLARAKADSEAATVQSQQAATALNTKAAALTDLQRTLETRTHALDAAEANPTGRAAQDGALGRALGARMGSYGLRTKV